MKIEFEWDEDKAEANWQLHGVSFELAQMSLQILFPSNALMTEKITVKSGLSSSEWRKAT